MGQRDSSGYPRYSYYELQAGIFRHCAESEVDGAQKQPHETESHSSKDFSTFFTKPHRKTQTRYLGPV